MKIAICELESVSPYSQSRYHNTEMLDKENHDDYEKRTWRNRVNADKDGNIFIPPMAFANCIKQAAQFLALPIKGEGKANYTKHFASGIMVADALILPIKKDEVQGEWLFVPSDGKRGGAKRVSRCFPLIPEWRGQVKFYVLDNKITKEVFQKVLSEAGSLIGIGRFRPTNWGYYGRFKISDKDKNGRKIEGIKWEEQ